jgi:uncharacterized protein
MMLTYFGDAVAGNPGRDCNRATTPSETQICGSPKLSELDDIVWAGYAFIKARQGSQLANQIGATYWRLKSQCLSNQKCIGQRQIEEIKAFQALGAPISLPAWVAGKNVDDVITDDKKPSQSQIAQADKPSQKQPAEVDNSTGPYPIEGVGLGDSLSQKDVFQTLECAPRKVFQSATWCQRSRQEKNGAGVYSNSIAFLRSDDGRAYYLARIVEPSYFAPDDVNREIDRLSKINKQTAKVVEMPATAGWSRGVIASWGDVALSLLDTESVQLLAAGIDPKRGVIVDFLGNFRRSAQAGLPIYLLSGGPGMIWNANVDENGKGMLRISSIDASKISLISGPPAPPSSQTFSVVPLVLPQAVKQVEPQKTIESPPVAEKALPVRQDAPSRTEAHSPGYKSPNAKLLALLFTISLSVFFISSDKLRRFILNRAFPRICTLAGIQVRRNRGLYWRTVRRVPDNDGAILNAYVGAKLKYPGMRIRALGANGRTIVPSARVASDLDILPRAALPSATSDHQSAPPSLVPEVETALSR